ncbi:unknown [Prevotella sp. CAG:1185]|nr:unknown [Prevotella sp. CAG:1185]
MFIFSFFYIVISSEIHWFKSKIINFAAVLKVDYAY